MKLVEFVPPKPHPLWKFCFQMGIMDVIKLIAIVLVLGADIASAEPFRISASAMPDICVRPGLRPFVSRAAADLANDLERVFGVRPAILTNETTTGNSIVLEKKGAGWECFSLRSVTNNVLRIAGSDDRGVMFGVYRFCERFLGVDPFYRWSGLFPGRTDQREWNAIAYEQREPSFRFRGWFVNDEDFLNGWKAEKNGRREIDYKRYQVVFGEEVADMVYEAAVRAGFNTMICASYVNILNLDERRLVEVASGRGLFITMHHQEPVGASGWLWKERCKANGLENPSSYAEDPEGMRAFWREHVEAWAKVPDVIWQLGLRGVGDIPFWLKEGQWQEKDVDEGEERRRATLISDAIRVQLELITAELGRRPEHVAVQLWMEGAAFYEKGLLDIPQNAIVIHSDNCPGWKFQPDVGSVVHLRAPKAGLYYHLAVVQGNHRVECVPPWRTHEILSDAWGKGARELIIVNVSNIRPFLYSVGALGEMVRDLKAFDASRFRDDWIAARLSANREALGEALERYFAAYAMVDSRDGCSSYGAETPRAKLAAFNDGVLFSLTENELVNGCDPAKPVPKPDAGGGESLMRWDRDMRERTTADMFPYFVSRRTSIRRATKQAEGFARARKELEKATEPMSAEERGFLFGRFAYPIRFMELATRMYVAAASGTEARANGDGVAMRRHMGEGVRLAAEMSALDREYCRGKWEHWYDRDIIYPWSRIKALFDKLMEESK